MCIRNDTQSFKYVLLQIILTLTPAYVIPKLISRGCYLCNLFEKPMLTHSLGIRETPFQLAKVLLDLDNIQFPLENNISTPHCLFTQLESTLFCANKVSICLFWLKNLFILCNDNHLSVTMWFLFTVNPINLFVCDHFLHQSHVLNLVTRNNICTDCLQFSSSNYTCTRCQLFIMIERTWIYLYSS